MRGRNALIVLICGLMLGASQAPAQENQSQNDGNSRDDRADVRLDYIPLRLPGFDADVARRMVVVIDGELFGTELSGRVIRRNEDRIGLDGIPFLEDVSRFSYSSDMFTAQNLAGSAGLVADALILNIGVAPDRKPWLDDELLRRLGGVLGQPPLIQQPDLGTLNVSTVVVLNEGYSYAIAGLLVERVESRESQLPSLTDIPVIGSLFTTTNTDNNTTELLVVVTPTIFD